MNKSSFSVICLCAAWCDTCTHYRLIFNATAQEYPGVRFLWVDIEDQSDLVGDIDIETFPTLLIACGSDVFHYGPMLPHAEVLQRSIKGVLSAQTRALTTSPEVHEVRELWERLRTL